MIHSNQQSNSTELRSMLFEFEIKAHQTRIDALSDNQYENKMHSLLRDTAERIEKSYLPRKDVEEAIPERVKPTEGYANEPSLIAFKNGYNKCRQEIRSKLGLNTNPPQGQ